MRSSVRISAGAVFLLTAACGGSEPTTAARSIVPEGARLAESPADPSGVAYSPLLAELNKSLRDAGVFGVAIAAAELMTDTSGHAAATTLVANDRAHLFSSQFVPSDPRRGGSASISYLVDQSDGAALSFAPNGSVVVLPNGVTEPELDVSMAIWQDSPFCGAPTVAKVGDSGADPDVVDGLVFEDPTLLGTPQADITFAGWLSSSFFNRLAPNGAQFILGVTFTLIFVDQNDNPTDVDHDHYADAAFREIYFNRSFAWGADLRPTNIDIQSVAVHESGHAYGLAHFGKVFLDNNGTLKFAPHAIMNAVYVSPFRELTGTDNSSFCNAWANAR